MNTNTEFIQTNLKKSFVAAVELQRKLKEKKSFICLTTEPYKLKSKVRALPPKAKCIQSNKPPRAAIIHSPNINIVKLEHLTNADCAAGLIKIKNQQVVLSLIHI